MLVEKESMDTIDQATHLVEQAHNMRDKIQGKYLPFCLTSCQGNIHVWLTIE